MNMLKSIWAFISLQVFGKIKWNGLRALFHGGTYYDLTEDQQDHLRKLLAKDYYVILIRRKTHLTTYLISFATWIKTGKWGYWSHALMNLEGDVKIDQDFRLMEATGTGVHYSTFMQVFDCDSVCLLKPKLFCMEDWTETLDKLKTELGKPYDTLYDLSNDRQVSCVELVRVALEGSSNYLKDFPDFEMMISNVKTLAPDMFYNCKDFEVVYEARH